MTGRLSAERGISVSEERPAQRVLACLTAGLVIGVIEVVLASSFAALIFGGTLSGHLGEGVGLNLGAAALLLGVIAWTAGDRGIVGSVQDGSAAVLAVVAAAAAGAASSPETAFLTVVATMAVASIATGTVFMLLGVFRLGNLVRFAPYPVIGGFLAGTGWLLAKGGVGVASGIAPALRSLDDLSGTDALVRWLPALTFGVALLVVTRAVHRPLVIPAAIAIALLLFAFAMLATGSSIHEAEGGGWLLGPFPASGLWQPWTARALTGADWAAVLSQAGGIATVVFVSVLALLLNASGIELMLGRDLDSNIELRSASSANVLVGIAGGMPGFHALSLTSLAFRMRVAARPAGFVAAAVPLGVLLFGASLVSLIPRMLLGGLLLFLGLSFLVEWVVDARRILPRGEYTIVLAILGTIIGWGLLPGVALGLVLAVVLFAVSYSRTDPIRQAISGSVLRSNVDRPPAERQALRVLGEHVYILRLQGFVFFGTASSLLERIRERASDAEEAPMRFLVLDFHRVSGVDSSAVLSFRKTVQLAKAQGFELVFTALPAQIRGQLERGGVREDEAPVTFHPDLDRGVQRCEDALLLEMPGAVEVDPGDVWAALGGGRAGLAERIAPYLERVEIAAGEILIRQDDLPEDVFVLESGRLTVQLRTEQRESVRLRTIAPGTVVGEVALYAGTSRTATVVADVPSVVRRLSKPSFERMEAEDPELAAALHRWFARMLAERLSDTLRAVDALLD